MPDAAPRVPPWRGAVALAALGNAALVLALPRPLSPALVALALPLVAAVTVSGAVLGWSCGAGAPLLDAILHARPAGCVARRACIEGTVAGLALGIASLLLLRFVLLPAMPIMAARLAAEAARPFWQRWVIAFDSAVLEELLYRLFVVSGIAVLLRRIARHPGRLSPGGTLRIGVVVAALLFAAAHLPRWAAMTGDAAGTAMTVDPYAAVLLLDTAGGLVFGLVYARRGIEAAMLAHFIADVVLHVAGPALLGLPA